MSSTARRRVLVSATILILPMVILAGAWRLGGVSALEDDLIYYLPVRQYIAERIAAGEFPLWNPLVAMGTSVAADPQSGLWYPPTYLFLLLPPLVAYPASLVLHFALAGAGMYRFLRASRHVWLASLLGAVAFEFCGYLVAHRAHLTIHHAVAWLPWMLYGWRRFADTGERRFAVLASAAFGMQLLVQHVQISIITAALVTGYVAVVLMPWHMLRPFRRNGLPTSEDGRSPLRDGHSSLEDGHSPLGGGHPARLKHRRDAGATHAARLWWVYPAGMTIGAMLAGVQLVPTGLHYAGSVRGAPSYYLFTENSWLPTSALMLLFPMLFGSRTPNVWSEPWWGPSHFCEQSAYASILVLVLAFASIRLIRRPVMLMREPFGERLSRRLRMLRRHARYGWMGFSSEPPVCSTDKGDAAPEMSLTRHNPASRHRRPVWQAVRAGLRRLPYGWNRDVAFWWGACLIALLIALGDLTPLSDLLFQVPVYRSFRVPARWILVWSVAMPVLASGVVSAVLVGAAEARRVQRVLRFTLFRVLPACVVVALLLLAIAVEEAHEIAEAFPSPRAIPKIAGLLLAGRVNNPAIWWPILVMVTTGGALLNWLRMRSTAAFALMFVVFLIDVSSVAAFVDVDVRTYSRQDLIEPPPLARAIRELGPRPGDRLLVPRIEASYDRPIEVLWPQSNLRYGIATFNGYGPLWPVESRMLFRFMPWGSSEEMLALLRNPFLLRAMGIRFIAVRSEEERSLLDAAQIPPLSPAPERPVPGGEQIVPVRYGQDLLWGPMTIRRPGLYELSFDAQPVADSPSRWFVRLETPDGEEIDRTRTIDPADMAAGARRMRFLYQFDEPIPTLLVRVKSEMGQALSAGRAILRQIGTASIPAPAASETMAAIETSTFIHRADLPGGISLYEVPGARPLVYWADAVETVPDLVTAVERLHAGVASAGSSAEPATVVEQDAAGRRIPVAQEEELRFERVSGREVTAVVGSSNGGLLVFNESYDAGWQAIIDGRVMPTLRVNAVCQGVSVPPGTHEVVFRYQPPGLKAGMALSCTSLLILLIGAGLTRRILPWGGMNRDLS